MKWVIGMMLISGGGHVSSVIDPDASGDRNNAPTEDTEPSSKKNKVERSLKESFNTIPELLLRRRLAEKYKEPNGGRKDTTKHEPVFLKDSERLRCTR